MKRANLRMNELINEVSNYNCVNALMSVENVCLLLNPEFKEVDGAILLDLSKDINPNKINIEKILKVYGDYTSYECSCNEIRLNDYIDYPEADGRSVFKFALQLQECWMKKIKIDYPSYNFCFILSYDGEFATLRFHRVRESEKLYLLDNIESYLEEGILEIQI